MSESGARNRRILVSGAANRARAFFVAGNASKCGAESRTADLTATPRLPRLVESLPAPGEGPLQGVQQIRECPLH